ncbi:MAG TPA: universal stress protein, partial [Pyrinomonadaceae bacterium]|nr:universal stress protein [Pyrinomonadaceae bacterium]
MKILIATDGSEFSRATIEECCRLAVRSEGTEIEIVSVYENVYPVAAEPFAVSAEYVQEMEDAARNQAHNFAAEAQKQIRECLPGLSAELTTKVVKGSPDQAVVEEAENWAADLLVVGSHGRGFWGRMFLGSVSQSVINHAPCSVLVVRRAGSHGMRTRSKRETA